MRLILVRHGQTDWNKEYRVQGQADLALNESGRAQAEAIARALEGEKVEAIYSSPLRRALQTARAVDAYHGVGVTTDEGLKELDVGELDGIYYPDVKTRCPDFFRLWTADAARARFPGGESLPELQARVWAAIRSIIGHNHGGSVVVASHLFALLSLMCRVLGLELSDFRRLNLSVASITRLELHGDGARLVCFNETCHLR